VSEIYAPSVLDSATSFEAEPPAPQEMQRRMAEILAELPWLVCVLDGRAAGFAYASRHRERQAYQWSLEVSLYVAGDAHRRGVGRRLYGVLFDLLRRQGYCNVYSGITLPNDASVGLHEAMGFEKIGVYSRVGFKLGEWHDVGWWQLGLRDAGAQPGALLPFPVLRDQFDWAAC
jgi:L-amino acid N-acyltransferase YncA